MGTKRVKRLLCRLVLTLFLHSHVNPVMAFGTGIAASLDYSTYFGGSLADEATDVAIGPEGTLYVVGVTNSSDLPFIGSSTTQTFPSITTSLAQSLPLPPRKEAYKRFPPIPNRRRKASLPPSESA